MPVARPGSVAELGELVRRAASDGQAVYPSGGQTMMQLGNAPTKPGVAIDLRGLDQVIDFPARDMTITVQAGITIARLQALLAPENLRLPIDVPEPERATLGGILASNVSGPRRLGYGTLRDYLIGNDEGQVPLRKLRWTLTRLPRSLGPKEVAALDRRITALTSRPQLPKGAIPKSMRPPKGAFRAMRGGPPRSLADRRSE